VAIRDAIISREKKEISNQIKSIMNVWGTCDIKMRDHNLEAKGKGEKT
jgi:hypothetical protein